MNRNKRYSISLNTQSSHQPWVAIVGNPNCGKTAIFNRLTGLHQRVGNYPGITVEKKTGLLKGHNILIRDLPGTYSLKARSIDEKIVADTVQEWRNPKKRPRAVIVVVDATNISRNIYLALQILDWNVPTVVVLNMMDEAEKKGIKIDHEEIRKQLRAWAVIPASAKYGRGIKEIISTIAQIPDDLKLPPAEPRVVDIEQHRKIIAPLVSFLQKRAKQLNHNAHVEALRLLAEKGYINYITQFVTAGEIEELQQLLDTVKQRFKKNNIPYHALEQSSRFAFIDLYLSQAVVQENIRTKSRSERFDALITHKVFGPLILIILLGFIFNAIFSWAQYPMELIQTAVDWLTTGTNNILPDGQIKNLLINGILAGVGSILIFLPQILLLVFFLGILEDSGYMARMAFMLDRMMHKIGLHGRSVLPLLSGFACAIPAVMAARTIEDRRDRIVTIMMIPLMSCSARLPVYILLIAAFIPNTTLLGFISLQGLVLMGVYFLGMITAIIVALIFNKTKPPHASHNLMMELPPYRQPMLRSILWQLYERTKSFLSTAGSIILAISIVLWFLASYPKAENDRDLNQRQRIEKSFAGQLGKAIEPLIKPLGFDWKIGVGLITSFAAREVIVSTLSTLYNLEEETGQNTSLIEALRKDRYPDGRPVFSLLTALSLMVFFVYAAQCMATFAIIKKETNSWRWPIFMVAYMTTLAYIASLLVYQGGILLGY